MKKTNVCFTALIIMAMLFLSSCGKSNESSGNNADNVNTVPQQGAFMQNQADLYGEVKSISGNQITIALIEMPQRRQMTDEERKQFQGNRDNNDPQEGQRSSRQRNGNEGDNGSRGEGGIPGGNGFMGERKLTGQTETITVAEGTPITAFSRNNGQNQQNDLKITDIKEGSTIQVWYKKDSSDKKELDHIRITQAPAQDK